MNAVAAFWCAYVVTRPLGASFADYISKPPAHERDRVRRRSDGLVFTVAVAALVLYLAIAQPDIQPTGEPPGATGTLRPGDRRTRHESTGADHAPTTER